MTLRSSAAASRGTESDARPRVWTVFVAIVLPFVGEFVAAAAVLVAVVVARRGSGLTRAELTASMHDSWSSVSGLVMASLLLGIALLGAKLSKRGVASRLALSPTRNTVLELALGSMGAVAASAAIHTATRSLLPSYSERPLRESVMTSQGIGWTLLTVALFVVITPNAEELLFRGYIQTRLCARWGPLAGIAITSVAFGFYHLPGKALFAVFFGAYLGWVAHVGGGTRPAILAHMANNLVASVGLLSVPHAMPDTGSRVTSVAIAAGAAIVAAACIAGMVVLRARRAADRACPGSGPG